MELRKAEKSNYEELKDLYIRAFPDNERMPIKMIEDKISSEKAEILEICDDNKFVGFAIMLINGKDVLLDYFAFMEGERGRGYGSEALRLISERYGDKTVIIEIESPESNASDDDIKVRRKKFYLKNGMLETGITVELFGVKMELLINQGKTDFERYKSVYTETFGSERLSGKIIELK